MRGNGRMERWKNGMLEELEIVSLKGLRKPIGGKMEGRTVLLR